MADATTARLVYGSTYLEGENSNFDLLWLIRMRLPDAHYFVEFGEMPENRVLLTGALEFTRAKIEAKNCRVELIDFYAKDVKKEDLGGVVQFLRFHNISRVELHPLTPAFVMESLINRGFKVGIGKTPWYPARYIRTVEEIGQITEVQRKIEEVFELVRVRLANASISGGVAVEGAVALTSEIMRKFIEDELYKRGCGSIDTIVSSGADAAVPHHTGKGPLRAHAPIVFDIYPYSKANGRFADMTRTLFKGTPEDRILQMYDAVREGQELGIQKVKQGADGKDIHSAIVDFFRRKGFFTNPEKGEGFIHGTGHSLNYWLHEPPSISLASRILQPGMLLTVEPGLYYPERHAGVRLEDMVVVEENGCRNLTNLPKSSQWAVIP